MIKYLKHKEIDKVKWNTCIEQSDNGLIYALSWYLDIVSPGWEALVEGDYKSVMPLTSKRKFGITYMLQPFFTQQLGVFGSDTGEPERFVKVLPKEYKLVTYHFNSKNISQGFASSYRPNYTIILSNNNSYSRNCKRNIKKAKNAGLSFEDISDINFFINFTKDNLNKKVEELKNKDYNKLSKLLQAVMQNATLKLRVIKNEAGEVLAAGSCLLSNNRIIFHVCSSTNEGKSKQAMYLLVHSLIDDYKDSGMIFDFSGSNIKGVAYFNASFGAAEEQYPVLKVNKLPFILKWLKR